MKSCVGGVRRRDDSALVGKSCFDRDLAVSQREQGGPSRNTDPTPGDAMHRRGPVRTVASLVTLMVAAVGCAGPSTPSHTTAATAPAVTAAVGPTVTSAVVSDCDPATVSDLLPQFLAAPQFRIVRAHVGASGEPRAVDGVEATVFTPIALTDVAQLGGDATVPSDTVWVEGGVTSGRAVLGESAPGLVRGADVLAILWGGRPAGTVVVEAAPIVDEQVYLEAGVGCRTETKRHRRSRCRCTGPVSTRTTPVVPRCTRRCFPSPWRGSRSWWTAD
jgi:hypothetical protein